jgi:hypothetical protein
VRSFASVESLGRDFFLLKPLQHSIIVLEEFCQTAQEKTSLKEFRFFDNN